MEVIKDLPEVFEEFAEQRKNSFLAIKKIKDQNIPVIGSYCTYVRCLMRRFRWLSRHCRKISAH